jgi:hypothetical protein
VVEYKSSTILIFLIFYYITVFFLVVLIGVLNQTVNIIKNLVDSRYKPMSISPQHAETEHADSRTAHCSRGGIFDISAGATCGCTCDSIDEHCHVKSLASHTRQAISSISSI